ncbi:kinase-like domain-containing protein, partial [Lactarius sanguifluus]
LPYPQKTLIDLTDFGLSRKIDPDDPWLGTRCVSGSYTAPELLVGVVAAYSTTTDADTYDGRRTDAWALGVVFFALATRALPFDTPLMLDVPPADTDIERVRRRWVLRVVRGEWAWPAAVAPVGEEGEARKAQLVRHVGVRDVMVRLLVCGPRWRERVGALWDEPWMRQGEAVVPWLVQNLIWRLVLVIVGAS